MQVSVTFRHFEPSDTVRSYATEKVEHIADKYLKRAESAHVILNVVKKRHLAEIHIHSPHFDLSAHDQTADMHSAIDGALAKLETQMRRHHDRINHHKGHDKVAMPEPTMLPVDVVSAEGAESTPLVETEKIRAKRLTTEDAMLQLELTHSEFLVFRNAANENLTVIYRRKDGHYGLVIPTD